MHVLLYNNFVRLKNGCICVYTDGSCLLVTYCCIINDFESQWFKMIFTIPWKDGMAFSLGCIIRGRMT